MFPTAKNSMTNLAAALQNSQIPTESNLGSKAFLRFDFKTGRFFFGRDQEEVTGDTLVLNIASFTHGWTLWVNGKPQKVQSSFNEPLPNPMAPVDGTDPSESRGFEARFEDDSDTIVVFETSSYGGRKGCDAILGEAIVKAKTGSEYLFPVVKLDSESYKSQQGGTIHNPMFKAIGWMDQNGNLEGDIASLDAPEDEEPVAPARRRRVTN